MNYSLIATKLRYKISRFSGELSKNLDKTCQRFIRESIYGILSQESVMLTEIGRSLNSEVSLKKIEERFCRQLAKAEIQQTLHHQIARHASNQITENSLLILDISDIKKKYAQSMEYLAKVRDGSSAKGELVNGYWTINVIATQLNSQHITPVYHGLYSQNAPDFESENDEILDTIDHISQYTSNKGIWVIDRGGDRNRIFLPMLRKKREFIIRLVGSRHLISGNKMVSALSLAKNCSCPYSEFIVKVKHGKEVKHNISYGYVQVRLPEKQKVPLYMLVVKGFGENPMMLLTTIPLRRNRRILNQILQSYIKRWSIEETIRYLKQSYDFENIRVLTYTRLKNMAVILLAAMYFITTVLDSSSKLKILASHLLKSAKRVFGIPDFKYYALSDGLHNVFQNCPGYINPCKKKPNGQFKFEFG
jgi:hypothetical protein